MRFKYKSHRTQRVEVLTLSIDQFIERLMQHVPLPGKASVRYSGLYASSSRVNLNRARALLGQPVKTGREALVWPAYLEQLGYAPLCEV
ncbi:MAG: transposase, partial [Porticoccaceae bacterium]|nr:transposase [Porticoccaceae bacterium]